MGQACCAGKCANGEMTVVDMLPSCDHGKPDACEIGENMPDVENPDQYAAAAEEEQQASNSKQTRELAASPSKELEATDSTREYGPTEDENKKPSEVFATPPKKKYKKKGVSVSFEDLDGVGPRETSNDYYQSREEADVEAGKQCKFSVNLKKKQDDKWGFHLFYSDDGKHTSMKDVTGLAIENWHVNNPTKLIRFGDEVVSFNGTSGDCKKLMQVMRNNNELEVVLRRKLEIQLRTRKPFGIDFKGVDELEVVDIKAGGIMSYNESCLPKLVIGPGDTLVGVNGRTSNLFEEFQKAPDDEDVKLIFRRPSVE